MIKKVMNYWAAKRSMKHAKRARPQMIYGYNQNGVFLKDTRIGSATAIVGEAGLTLADNVFIGQFNFIESTNGVKIEEGCQITNYISILTHSSHISIRLYGDQYRSTSDHKAYNKGSVHIGKYSFVGPHVTIMPEVKLGKGCLVAAYSFVKGEFPDFSIIGGNPAKVIGDTRDMDKSYLEQYPELKSFYNKWAQG